MDKASHLAATCTMISAILKAEADPSHIESLVSQELFCKRVLLVDTTTLPKMIHEKMAKLQGKTTPAAAAPEAAVTKASTASNDKAETSEVKSTVVSAKPVLKKIKK